ncbi:MAG: hypothetical protein ACRDL4_10070, partial [Thermoleophilaceae bacterium]
PDEAIADLAGRQHGVVARSQVMELGLSGDAIDRRLQAKRLLPLYCAVYAVGHHNRSRETAWMAAVLAGGAKAVLSHRAAGALYGIWSGNPLPIDVTTPRGQHRRRGIRFHRAAVPDDEVTIWEGIPTTTVPRTIFDLAATEDRRRLEKAINEAEIRRLWDELSLDDLLHRYPRRPGSRNVRAALRMRRAGASFTRSELEELFVRFSDRAGLPRPETNAPVEGYEVDCVWRAQRLIIEVDSWETHRTRAAFERDREKSRILQAADWRCVPVTFLQLRDRPADVARDVRRMLGATVPA